MTGDIAERNSTASISKRAWRSAFSMMSTVTGSTSRSGISAIFISRLPDQQVEVAVDLGDVAVEDHGRGVELGDDRWAGDDRARLQVGAGVRARLQSDLHRLRLGQLGLWAVARPDGAQVDDLRRGVRHPEAVELLVELVEALVQPFAPPHRDLIALAAVAHVGEDLDVLGLGGDALRVHPVARPRLEVANDLGRVAVLGGPLDQRLRDLVAEPRDEIAER